MTAPQVTGTLTPRETAVADTPQLAGALGLDWIPGGYGLLFCEDSAGEHWTVVTADAGYVNLMRTATPAALAGLDVPAEKFPLRRHGWPDEWA